MKYLASLLYLVLIIYPCLGSTTPMSVQIIEDYDEKSREESQDLNVWLKDLQKDETYAEHPDVKAMVDRLNVEPANKDHLYACLHSASSPQDIRTLFKTAVYLMSSPDTLEDVRYARNGEHFIDSRALHILNFVYLCEPTTNLLRPVIDPEYNSDPWLYYYYALALVYFPDIAEQEFGRQNTIHFAYSIYDEWLAGQVSGAIKQHRATFNERGDNNSIPMEPVQKRFQRAHAAFCLALEFKMCRAILSAEKTGPFNPEDSVWLEGLRRYDPDLRVKCRPPQQKSFRQGTMYGTNAFIFLGAAFTAYQLLSRVGKPFDHK
jgi:hypothetical protein